MTSREPVDVLIIGGGVAGLAAAAELTGSGLQVQLLEARQRLGGRIHTIHDPLSAMPIELGAEFIHNYSEHLWELVHSVPLQVGAVEGESLVAQDGEFTQRHNFWDAWGEMVRRMEQMTEDDLPYDEFVSRYAADLEEEDRQAARAFVQGFNAADATRVSTRWLYEGEKVNEAIGEGNFRWLQGYDQVVHTLRHRAFTTDFHLNTVVREVHWAKGSVQLRVQSSLGQDLQEFSARSALITVPVSLLREGSPAFTPELPDKLAAAQQIQIGPVVRITFRFREGFWWEEHPDLSFLLSRDEVMPTWWTSLPAAVPLLTGWVAGPAAQKLRGKSASEVADAALRALARILRRDRAELEELVEAWYTHDWEEDPYSRGAYSWVISGQTQATAQLAAPVEDTLFFAGEATNLENQSATVHGAIATGKRAAREIRTALGHIQTLA